MLQIVPELSRTTNYLLISFVLFVLPGCALPTKEMQATPTSTVFAPTLAQPRPTPTTLPPASTQQATNAAPAANVSTPQRVTPPRDVTLTTADNVTLAATY